MKRIMNCICILFVFFFIGCNETVDPLEQNKLSGGVISQTTCKNMNSLALKMINTPDTLSCVEYSYDAQNRQLLLKHINAGFNCCSSRFKSGLLLEGDTIIVEEYEEGEVCRCECLYDLEISIDNVSLQLYQLKVNESYNNVQKPLFFELDLKRETSGFFCATRNQYPWSMSLTRQ